jgi:hypothetical protein
MSAQRRAFGETLKGSMTLSIKFRIEIRIR